MTFFVLSVFPAPDSPLRLRQYSDPDGNTPNLRDEDTLIFAFITHINPGTLCNGKDMRRVLIAALASILMYYRIGVQW